MFRAAGSIETFNQFENVDCGSHSRQQYTLIISCFLTSKESGLKPTALSGKSVIARLGGCPAAAATLSAPAVTPPNSCFQVCSYAGAALSHAQLPDAPRWCQDVVVSGQSFRYKPTVPRHLQRGRRTGVTENSTAFHFEADIHGEATTLSAWSIFRALKCCFDTIWSWFGINIVHQQRLNTRSIGDGDDCCTRQPLPLSFCREQTQPIYWLTHERTNLFFWRGSVWPSLIP